MHNLNNFSVHDQMHISINVIAPSLTYLYFCIHGKSRTHFHGRVYRLSDPRSVFTVICGAELNETGSVEYCVSAVWIS